MKWICQKRPDYVDVSGSNEMSHGRGDDTSGVISFPFNLVDLVDVEEGDFVVALRQDIFSRDLGDDEIAGVGVVTHIGRYVEKEFGSGEVLVDRPKGVDGAKEKRVIDSVRVVDDTGDFCGIFRLNELGLWSMVASPLSVIAYCIFHQGTICTAMD